MSRARYCDRLVGMAAGKVVFDGAAGNADRRGLARALRHCLRRRAPTRRGAGRDDFPPGDMTALELPL